MKKSTSPLRSSSKFAIDKRTGLPWSQSTDPWEENLVYKTEELSNSQKIKNMIDSQVELLFKKSLQGKVLDGRELQTLVTCTELMSKIKDLDKDITKENDMSKLSTEELKGMLK